MAAGRNVGLRQPGLRHAFATPAEGDGTGGGIGGTSTSSIERIIETRGQQLTGIAGMAFWHEPFVVPPGTRGSYWRDMHGTDTRILDAYPGGVCEIFANAGYGVVVVDPHDAYPFITPPGGPSIVGVIDAAEPFYMFTRFFLGSDPGSGGAGGWQEGQCAFVIGVVDPTTLAVVGMGIAIDADSFFGAVGGDVNNPTSTTGIASTVPRDFDTWHVMELYTTGGKFWLKVDDGTPLDVSALFPGSAVRGTPFVQVIAADVTQPAIAVDHIAYGAGRGGATLAPLGPDAGGVAHVTAVAPLHSTGGANPAISFPSLTALGLALAEATDEAAAQTALALVPGTDVQAYSAVLAAVAAGITVDGMNLIFTTGVPGQQQALALEPGVDVQAYDADLAALAGVTSAADKIPYFTGAGAAAVADFPGAARTLLAATTEAAQRAAIGLSDLTDEALGELAHANTVCGFSYPSECRTFDNEAKIGTLGSRWTALPSGATGGLGNSGKGIVTSGWRGGANQITTGATAGSACSLIAIVNGLLLYGSSLMDDLVGATSKWQVEAVIRMDTTPDAQAKMGIGWIDPGGNALIFMGVQGSGSTTKFRVWKEGGGGTGATSTVNLDTNPHRLRMWGNGDGKIYFSVDNETPIQLTGQSWGMAATPYVTIENGSTNAAQTVTLGTIRYRTDGMAA
jgi:hypothetical protein